jgi:hypothetical protein
MCYASITGTAVVQVKEQHQRPKQYDGRLVLFGINADQSAKLQAELSAYGNVLCCNIKDGQAFVDFETHDVAMRALGGLKAQDRPATTIYNEVPYNERGWVCAAQESSFSAGRFAIPKQ